MVHDNASLVIIDYGDNELVDYAKGSRLSTIRRYLVAKYRFYKKPDGTYDIVGLLGNRGTVVFVASRKGFRLQDVAEAATEVASVVQEERVRRGMVRGDEGVPKVVE